MKRICKVRKQKRDPALALDPWVEFKGQGQGWGSLRMRALGCFFKFRFFIFFVDAQLLWKDLVKANEHERIIHLKGLGSTHVKVCGPPELMIISLIPAKRTTPDCKKVKYHYGIIEAHKWLIPALVLAHKRSHFRFLFGSFWEVVISGIWI